MSHCTDVRASLLNVVMTCSIWAPAFSANIYQLSVSSISCEISSAQLDKEKSQLKCKGRQNI